MKILLNLSDVAASLLGAEPAKEWEGSVIR